MQETVVSTILYHPEDDLFSRLDSIIESGCVLFIFDNSPDVRSERFLQKNLHKIRYFSNDFNYGIGPALRLMTCTAYHEGYKVFIYFDQDTIFNPGTLNSIFRFIESKPFNISNSDSDGFLSFTFRDPSQKRKSGIESVLSIGEYTVYSVDFTISSGTIFSLEKLKNIGWHDPIFKIDGVDYFICLSAKKNRLQIGEIYEDKGIDHRTGQGDIDFSFMGHKLRGRKYGMSRINDYVLSSIRLIFLSFNINIRMTGRLLKSLFAYIFIQTVIRIKK